MSLCTAIALSGLYLSLLQNKRLQLLRDICAFFREMRELGGTGFSSFPEIFERLSGERKYRRLTFIDTVASRYESGQNLREIWDCTVQSFCPLYMNSAIKGLLLSFSDVFGRCTREDFIKRCGELSVLAEGLLSASEKRYEKNRSMTVYSGVLAAAAIFFIFI